MCKATALRVFSAVAALLLAAPSLAARQTTQELLDRIEALTPEVERAAAESRAAQERRLGTVDSGPTLDTLMIGPVQVVTLPEQRSLALQIFGEALDHFGPWLDENPALRAQVITFQWATDPVVIPVEGQHRRVEGTRLRDRAYMVRGATTAIGSIASAAAAGSGVHEWFSGPVTEPEVAEAVYRVLATFPSVANKRCFENGGRACLTALGLGLDDFPYDDWYSEAERRRLVASHYYVRRRDRIADTEEGRMLSACLDVGDIPACDRFLGEAIYRSVSVAPLGHNDARPLLLYLALQAGGDGAWDRLVADPDMTPTEALEAASGLTAEELADQWHAWVMAQRPASHAGLGGTTLITVLTILAFVALSMRSTKWRLG